MLIMKFIVAIVAGMLISASVSCDKIFSAPGIVAGEILNEAGQPVGFVIVQLIDTETDSVAYQMVADDSGHFLFKEIDPGSYRVKVLRGKSNEKRIKELEFRISSYKTVTLAITVLPDEPEPE